MGSRWLGISVLDSLIKELVLGFSVEFIDRTKHSTPFLSAKRLYLLALVVAVAAQQFQRRTIHTTEILSVFYEERDLRVIQNNITRTTNSRSRLVAATLKEIDQICSFKYILTTEGKIKIVAADISDASTV